MNFELFSDDSERLRQWREDLYPGAVVLRRFCLANDEALLAAVLGVAAVSPFRESFTPGGAKMSVYTTGCGDYGATDDGNYRMSPVDPVTRKAWPPMPSVFYDLGVAAAKAAGFDDFEPNMTHINRYAPGAKLGMHQDRGESDTLAPIVSLSLGLPATFKLGGFDRSDPAKSIGLVHGDVVVWGGPARMRFHGVLPVKPGRHPLTGEFRYNLTIRRVCRFGEPVEQRYFT